jgi:putative transport protein
MIDWIIETLKANTHLVIFLALAIGYWVGKFKIGKFALGSVTGTLLAGVLIGQLGFDISPQVKTMFFTMFLFAVGYSVGPQFVQGVARDGLPQAVFGVVVSVLCLICVYVAASLLAGSQTISASIGLATTAINESGVENPEALLNQIPIAYAITYLWGTVGTGIILSVLGPKLLNVDIAEECRKYEAQMSKGTPAGGMNTAWQQLQMRAYRVKENGRAVGRKISELEFEHADSRLYVERLRRDGKIIDFDGNTVLKAGDVGVISGKTEALVSLSASAEEVADPELLDIPVESVDLVLTSKEANGKTLIELAKADFARGVFLRKITRGATSTDVPILAQTKLNRGDILKISGRKTHIQGWPVYRRVRPDRGVDGQCRRRADHAFSVRWRAVRWPVPGLGTQRASDVWPPA